MPSTARLKKGQMSYWNDHEKDFSTVRLPNERPFRLQLQTDDGAIPLLSV
jgi:hypothetical protein